MASSSSCVYTVSPVERKEFITAVQDFKKTNRIKFKELFAERATDPRRSELRQQFLNNHTIRSYLTRPSGSISFTEYHPDFNADRGSKQSNDYYECKIYSFAQELNLKCLMLPFRSRVSGDHFYRNGVHDSMRLERLIHSKQEDLIVTKCFDIYRIRNELSAITIFGAGNIRFVLSPNFKDQHATSVISILEKGTDRVLASIFLNSLKKPDYTSYIRFRFKMRGEEGMRIGCSSEKAMEVYKRISSELNGSCYKIDFEKRTGHILNKCFIFNNNEPECLEIEDAFKKNQIDLIYRLSETTARKCPSSFFTVQDRRIIPFLDASHSLQTADDDGNCGLYTLNFLQAAATMLSDTEVADRVYRLALELNDGNEEERSGSEASLINIFTEELKAYLPFYYHPDGTRKDDAALKEFHLRQRWDIGSRAFELHSV